MRNLLSTFSPFHASAMRRGFLRLRGFCAPSPIAQAAAFRPAAVSPAPTFSRCGVSCVLFNPRPTRRSSGLREKPRSPLSSTLELTTIYHMKPDFSEFSYGYAVTEELVSAHKAKVIAAPLFPSLYDEGKAGGGYDVKIPLAGKPVFLQFKLSDQLERSNSKEYKSGLLGLPYYRMHIRPTKHSDQHNLLLDLEVSGETVFYIAPEFHLPAELNSFYLSGSVVANSAAFSPLAIGAMPDDDEHYLVFERGTSLGYRCSEEGKEVHKFSLANGLQPILAGQGRKTRDLGERGLRDISNRMLNVLESGEERLRSRTKSFDMPGLRRIVDNRNPVESIGYMARTFFDAELLVLE